MEQATKNARKEAQQTHRKTLVTKKACKKATRQITRIPADEDTSVQTSNVQARMELRKQIKLVNAKNAS